jgi:CHAD domain-containing protein
VRARKVEGLDPSAPLADQAQRIVLTRLEEVEAFVPAVFDAAEVEALHDMRIAAKRLRYVLETMAEPCFGPYAAEAAERTKALQDLLGDVHDCDVLLPRVRALLDRAREEDRLEARRRGGDRRDLPAKAVRGLPHASSRRGLETLELYVQARREHLFERFLLLWRDLEREGLGSRLRYAITERPVPR